MDVETFLHVPTPPLLQYGRCTVYVGNLHCRLQWVDIFRLFRKYGCITRLYYPRNANGTGMGYALITYSNDHYETTAPSRINGKINCDRLLCAVGTIASDRDILTTTTVHIANFSDFVNESILKDVFGMQGTVRNVTIRWCVFGYRYAHVEFESALCTEQVVAQCHGMDLGDGFKLQVRHAHDRDTNGPLLPSQFRKLQTMRRKDNYALLSGVPATATERQLFHLVNKYANVKEVIVLRAFGRSTNYAVVQFKTTAHAKLAVCNAANVAEHTLKRVSVVWRPFDLPHHHEVI
ncbi:uncharacterized protein LOC128719077 [Anopheles marshallii]|uniref:uncharacterized protein LOC128719077 n=1 Tax=Anopheles marshallii TaxID=1521116 RepID=UPI00237BB863|nr:uncharacterized protein LOC128719077 [Anopheles marshallii]